MGVVEYVLDFVVGTAVRFAPLFFLSIGLAAVVKGLPIARIASRWLAQREHASVAAGSLLGTFSPFCSCTVVPVVRSLLIAGAPLAGVMAFWVASPLMDPEIFVLSVGLLGWDIAVARLVGALVLALAAGYGAIVAVRRGWLPGSIEDEQAADGQTTTAPAIEDAAREPAHAELVGASVAGSLPMVGGSSLALDTATDPADVAGAEVASDEDGCCGAEPAVQQTASCGVDSGCGSPDTDEPRGVLGALRDLDWRQVRADFLTESWTLGRWILLAFALEALILRFVPQEAMVAVLGSDAPWAVPLAALLGVPLYMDSLSALPVIDGLLAQGMAPGAAIAFLLAGPVTTIPAMTAVRAVLPGPVFRYYLGVSLLGSMAIGAAANLVL